MAASSHTQTIDQTQISPGDAVLTALVGRLRQHARGIHNAAARQTVGKDMKAAANVIEQLMADMPVDVAAAAAMVALLGRTGYAAYTGTRAPNYQHLAEHDGAQFTPSGTGKWRAADRHGTVIVRGAMSMREAARLYCEDRGLQEGRC